MARSLADRFDTALQKRIASGIVLAVVAVADVVLGGWFLAAFALLLGCIMAFEWSRLTCLLGDTEKIRTLVGILVGVGGAVAILAAMLVDLGDTLILVALVAVAGAGIAALVSGAPVTRTAIGVLYIGIPLACLISLRNTPEHGLGKVLWLLVVVWSVDTFAYFVGRTLGGPKLAPSISPGKTWAGLIGGMAGAALAGAVFAEQILLGWWHGALIATLLAVVAQAGDLFESWLKRRANVKDSGTLIPGHGGVLDRLDGLLFATPTFALLLAW